jgi:nitrogen fixation protein FixH
MSDFGMPRAHPARELRGVHVLAMVIAFFAVVIGANVAFITMALRTFPGEDVPRSYVQGLQYNDTLAAREAQAALGWQAEARLDRETGVVEVSLLDRNGAPLSGARLEGVLRRPLDARDDQALTFAQSASGLFVAPAPGLEPGQWRLRAVASRGADRFELEAQLQ